MIGCSARTLSRMGTTRRQSPKIDGNAGKAVPRRVSKATKPAKGEGAVDKPATERTTYQPRARFSEEHRVLLGILIQARIKAGITKKDLSLRLGKVHNHVDFIESHGRDLNFVEVTRICEIVGLPLAELVQQFSEQLDDVRNRSKPGAQTKRDQSAQ